MTNYFLKMLQHLHQHEEVLLYSNILNITNEEQQEVTDYLETKYKEESLEFPYQTPSFDQEAAIWAANILYSASHLLLHRENRVEDLNKILPPFFIRVTPSAMLSADLSLRFLPDLIKQTEVIDPEDMLIDILERHLTTWHYSGINYDLPINELDLKFIKTDNCLYQLYINRIIEFKKQKLAQHNVFYTGVKTSLGLYAADFWKEFTLANPYQHHEGN